MKLSPYDYESILSQNYTKLKDILVSLPVFNQTVSAFEGLYGFYLKRTATDKNGNKRDITSSSYVVPYMFIYPIISTMAKMFDTSYEHIEQDEDMRNLWIYNVKDRAMSYVECALCENEIDEFDKDQDAGVIVHMLTGKMTMFHYSKIQDVCLLHMHNNISDILNIVYELNHKGITRQRVMDLVKLQTLDAYRTVSIMTYNDIDPYNPSCKPTLESINDQAALPLEVQFQLDDDILCAMKEKKKIIITA
jgi:hypothetical protein